ncbi:hypothetical protein [Ascidiimonas sp. W6]|uniref:hypothetical protein n=1 Tax=Ascidiimonas meishanensis TaxID=3128903 RepID=UPI0030EBE8D6
MKTNLLFIAVIISFTCIAQNIESKIPNSAEAVISINGDRLIDLVSIAEFDDYTFAKEMFDKLNRKRDSSLTITSIEDLGFNLNSKAFYFYKTTDSINYHNFLVKLTDKNKFESLISERDREKIISEDGIRMMADNSSVALWNDNLLLFSGYEKTYNYLNENIERFMAQPENKELSDYEVKKRITSKWAKAYALSIFKGTNEASILNDGNYRANKDKNAVASVWVRNYGQLMEGAMSGIYDMVGVSSLGALKSSSNLAGFKSIVANLYLDENNARMTTEMEVNSDWGKIFENVYNSKLDKNFYNYFNQNDVLAYMSFSTDMQAFMEEYPTFITSVYGEIMPKYKEEMMLGSEFLSLVLDEEAIGELITGDMVLLLNDFGEKEVTYLSYEYDEEDYKRKEVTKTKKEVMPDFTIMIGSKKEKLLNKAALVAIKYELFENKEGYYKINAPKNEIPVDLYTAVKNDILFFTTSKEKISNIVNNRVVKNVGKHQKLMSKNSAVFYMNGQKMMAKIPASELNKKEQEYLKYANDHFKDVYFKSSKMKGNKLQSEMKINMATSQENSFKVFLDYIEVLAN